MCERWRRGGFEEFCQWQYPESLGHGDNKKQTDFQPVLFGGVCKFLTDNVSLCCWHLEFTVCTSCLGPGFSAETYGRSGGGVLQKMPLLHPDPLPPIPSPSCALAPVGSLPIASTCISLQEGCPQAAGLDFACIQEKERCTMGADLCEDIYIFRLVQK